RYTLKPVWVTESFYNTTLEKVLAHECDLVEYLGCFYDIVYYEPEEIKKL
ncbi:hypothetical protein TSAR_009925, partial [Trichomalopsis sarcophagae]